MSEIKSPVSVDQMTVEERVIAIENQLYILYLQINAITKLIIEKGIFEQEEITSNMESLNQEIYKVTQDLMEKASAEPAPESE